MPNSLDTFIQTIAKLRSPDGCPWDREQTHQSLVRYLLEETYEVVDAINADNPDNLKEELGDLLLQIVLHAQIASEEKQFDIETIASAINKKIIDRHPHVFGKEKLSSAKAVEENWERLKQKEEEKNGQSKRSAMDKIPKSMPALLASLKISEKAVNKGFEWEKQEDIWRQLDSELDELKAEIRALESYKSTPENQTPDETQTYKTLRENLELELGDVLFTLVNIARWLELNPEESLLKANEKFKLRFKKMEEISSKPLEDSNLEELDRLWKEAKILTKNKG